MAVDNDRLRPITKERWKPRQCCSNICRTMFEVFPEGCHDQLYQKRRTYLLFQGRSLNFCQPHQVEVDGWDKWSNQGPVDVRNNCWWNRAKKDLPYMPDDVRYNCWWAKQMKESIPDDAWNNCWRLRPMKDYPHQIMYKQLLMDKRTDGIHARWCTKQLLMYQTREVLSIPDDVQNNCW